jgi:hypothetical protein
VPYLGDELVRTALEADTDIQIISAAHKLPCFPQMGSGVAPVKL